LSGASAPAGAGGGGGGGLPAAGAALRLRGGGSDARRGEGVARRPPAPPSPPPPPPPLMAGARSGPRSGTGAAALGGGPCARQPLREGLAGACAPAPAPAGARRPPPLLPDAEARRDKTGAVAGDVYTLWTTWKPCAGRQRAASAS